jgi:hypothetical protein
MTPADGSGADRAVCELSGILFTEGVVAELDSSNNVSVEIGRQDVRTIRLVDGQMAERPVALFLFGLMVLAAAAAIAWIVYLNFFGPVRAFGWKTMTWIAGFPAMGWLGVWFIRQSLRRGVYLEVTTTRDLRKLSFRERPSRDELVGLWSDLQRSPWSRSVEGGVPTELE